jgi:RHS repeat-associated protein
MNRVPEPIRSVLEKPVTVGAPAGSGTAGEKVTYIHTDGLGSPVARSDSAGNVISRTSYEPYGRTAGGVDPTIGFTGHVNDADTGLVYMQQRYYNPMAGRFLRIDPVTTDADTGRSFKRYAYAENNPFKYIDPDGRQIFPVGTKSEKKEILEITNQIAKSGPAGKAFISRMKKDGPTLVSQGTSLTKKDGSVVSLADTGGGVTIRATDGASGKTEVVFDKNNLMNYTATDGSTVKGTPAGLLLHELGHGSLLNKGDPSISPPGPAAEQSVRTLTNPIRTELGLNRRSKMRSFMSRKIIIFLCLAIWSVNGICLSLNGKESDKVGGAVSGNEGQLKVELHVDANDSPLKAFVFFSNASESTLWFPIQPTPAYRLDKKSHVLNIWLGYFDEVHGQHEEHYILPSMHPVQPGEKFIFELASPALVQALLKTGTKTKIQVRVATKAFKASRIRNGQPFEDYINNSIVIDPDSTLLQGVNARDGSSARAAGSVPTSRHEQSSMIEGPQPTSRHQLIASTFF